jgi:hypothetical protein
MTYYDYLCDLCDKLNSTVEDLLFEEACTRAESDDVRADALATEVARLDHISVAIWDKVCRAALYAA